MMATDIKEMRHEVIELAILLEKFLNEEILTYFGLDSWDASYHMQIERQRDVFMDSFLNMNLSRKFALIKKIVKDLNEDLYNDFGEDEKKFRDIRNTFAHTLYPEVNKEFMPKMQIDLVKMQQKSWETMYEEAKVLYLKIIKELDNKFYTKEPRTMKYRRFDQVQLLETIKHYEKLIEDEKSKKK
jgi:hypothetical protein